MVFLGSRMYFQFVPRSTSAAPGRFTLVKPKVFDVGVIGVAVASNHAESVHGIHNIGVIFGSFASNPHFHEERILKMKNSDQSIFEFGKNQNAYINSFFLLDQFPFFHTSCVIKRIVHF